RMTGRVHGRLRLAAAGTAIGLAAAGVVLGFAGIPGAGARPRAADEPFLEVGHLAPKLRAPGEPAQLRFELRCVPPDGDVEASLSDCNAAGTVYVRAGAAGSFTAVP